jgi:hypothetical protein
MKLMTEVFDAWLAERLQKPQQQCIAANGLAYPPAQLNQHLAPQQQAAYYYSNVVVKPPSAPNHILPMSPPLTPNTPSTGYPSPAPLHAAPNNSKAYQPPLQGAVEMPVELPGNTTLAVPAPVPNQSISTEVSNS